MLRKLAGPIPTTFTSTSARQPDDHETPPLSTNERQTLCGGIKSTPCGVLWTFRRRQDLRTVIAREGSSVNAYSGSRVCSTIGIKDHHPSSSPPLPSLRPRLDLPCKVGRATADCLLVKRKHHLGLPAGRWSKSELSAISVSTVATSSSSFSIPSPLTAGIRDQTVHLD